MDTARFSYNGGEVVVRTRQRVRDQLESEAIQAALSTERPHEVYWSVVQFARFVTSVTDPDGVLPFAIPATADTAAIATAYDAFMEADAELLKAWSKASEAGAVGKADTAPEQT